MTIVERLRTRIEDLESERRTLLSDVEAARHLTLSVTKENNALRREVARLRAERPTVLQDLTRRLLGR